MSSNDLALPDGSVETGQTTKPHSPCSFRSSPFSSNMSETELDTSRSPHSSMVSLSNANVSNSTSTYASSQPKLFKPISSSSTSSQDVTRPSSMTLSNHDGALGRMRLGNTGDSDEDSMEEESNCSCTEILNASLCSGYTGERARGNEGIVRHLSDTALPPHDLSRKFSLNSALLHTGTPSPSTSGRCSPVGIQFRGAMPNRSRVANIRRESNCSVQSEAAHEKLVKTALQVSMGFEEFSLADKQRKRTHSLSEPISILTNAFIPHSCSPSPTRVVDIQKQCYSPATQQIVRNNISYSPSPSPTPSPTRRILRSLSPIAMRQLTKRRYTGSAGVDSDGESSSPGVSAPKRASVQQWPTASSGGASPLASEALSAYAFPLPGSASPGALERLNGGGFPAPFPPFRMLLDPAIERQRLPSVVSPADSDECASNIGDDDNPNSPFIPKQHTKEPSDLNESLNKNDLNESSSSMEMYEKRDDDSSDSQSRL